MGNKEYTKQFISMCFNEDVFADPGLSLVVKTREGGIQSRAKVIDGVEWSEDSESMVVGSLVKVEVSMLSVSNRYCGVEAGNVKCFSNLHAMMSTSAPNESRMLFFRALFDALVELMNQQVCHPTHFRTVGGQTSWPKLRARFKKHFPRSIGTIAWWNDCPPVVSTITYEGKEVFRSGSSGVVLDSDALVELQERLGEFLREVEGDLGGFDDLAV